MSKNWWGDDGFWMGVDYSGPVSYTWQQYSVKQSAKWLDEIKKIYDQVSLKKYGGWGYPVIQVDEPYVTVKLSDEATQWAGEWMKPKNQYPDDPNGK